MVGLTPNFELELINSEIYKSNKIKRVIGIDEVGRGCWAGEVVVGAYIFSSETEIINNVNDSKKLSVEKRNQIFDLTKKSEYKLEWGSVDMIDKYGIGKTIEKLILRLINSLNNSQTFFLIDGQFSQEFGKNVYTTWHGDSIYYSIAMASILAKVVRDRYMDDMSKKYMYYGFSTNKGYGTKDHAEALKKFGVSEIHRKSYKPVASSLPSPKEKE